MKWFRLDPRSVAKSGLSHEQVLPTSSPKVRNFCLVTASARVMMCETGLLTGTPVLKETEIEEWSPPC